MEFPNLSLTIEQLAVMLAQAKAKAKAEADLLAAKPRHAYLIVLADSTLVYWQGQADTEDEALAAAMAHGATKGEVFGICKRPLPGPKGRKAGSKLETGSLTENAAPVADGDNAAENAAQQDDTPPAGDTPEGDMPDVSVNKKKGG